MLLFLWALTSLWIYDQEVNYGKNFVCARRTRSLSIVRGQIYESTDPKDFVFCKYAPHWQDGQPLIRNKFLAWKYGPVVRELYERLKEYEIVSEDAFSDIISIMDKGTKKPIEEKYTNAVEVIVDAYNRWSRFSAYKLVKISHWEEGAWYKTKRQGKDEISDVLILSEFNARYEQQ